MVDQNIVKKYRDRQYKKVFEKGGPIRSISLFSTGIGEGHHEHIYGSWKPALWWIFKGKKWVTLPLNVFVIEHNEGVILFDAGMDRRVVTDPNYWPEGFTGKVMRSLFKFNIMSYDLIIDMDGNWLVTEMSVLFGDLSNTIYDQTPIYKRHGGIWTKENMSDNQVERLINLLVKETWNWQ